MITAHKNKTFSQRTNKYIWFYSQHTEYYIFFYKMRGQLQLFTVLNAKSEALLKVIHLHLTIILRREAQASVWSKSTFTNNFFYKLSQHN